MQFEIAPLEDRITLKVFNRSKKKQTIYGFEEKKLKNERKKRKW